MMYGDVLPQEKYLAIQFALTVIGFSACAPVPGNTAASNQADNATNCTFPGTGSGSRLTYVNSHDDGFSNTSISNITSPTNINQSWIFEHNTTLFYACLEGHGLIGGSLQLTCTYLGEWNNTVPNCTDLNSGYRISIGTSLSTQIVACLIAVLALVILILLPLDFWNYRRKKERVREYLKRGRADRNKVRPLPFYIKQQAAHPPFGGIWTTHRLANNKLAALSNGKNEHLLKPEYASDLDYTAQTQSEQEVENIHHKERRKKNRFRHLKLKGKQRKVTPFGEEEELTDEQISEAYDVTDLTSECYTTRANRGTLPPLKNTQRLDVTNHGQLRELNIRPMQTFSTRIAEDDEPNDELNATKFVLPNAELEFGTKTKKQRRSKRKDPAEQPANNMARPLRGNYSNDDGKNDKSYDNHGLTDTLKPVAQPKRNALSKELAAYINQSFEDDYRKQFSDDGGFSDDGRISHENARMGMHENV